MIEPETAGSLTAGPSRSELARTLAEALRQLDADALAQLLIHRPDLAAGRPSTLNNLANLAASTTSVTHALDELNLWQQQIAVALAALPDPTTMIEVAQLLAADSSAVQTAIADLRCRALLWGTDDELHLVRSVRDQLGPYPGGLAPPAPAPIPKDQVAELLAAVTPKAREVVEQLLWYPAGRVNGADRSVTVDQASTPIEELLARRILRPAGPDTVVLAREVAWELRDHQFGQATVSTTAPELTGALRSHQLVDQAAIGAAYELVHDIELILHLLETSRNPLNRDGGVAVRATAHLTRELGCEPIRTAFLLEVAAATSLIGAGDGGRLLPTGGADTWGELAPVDRWRSLVAGWRHDDRLLSLGDGSESQTGVRVPRHALGPEADAPGAGRFRDLLLTVLSAVPVGTVIDFPDLLAALSWHRPRIVRIGGVPIETVLEWTWREAGWLGLTSFGAVSGLLAAAASAETTPLPESLAAAFPTTVDGFVLQADLTAVTPGPATAALTRDLRLLADQESRGGAAVFRFSAGSLRRGYRNGWSAAEIQRWLAQHARTPVPQALTYLVEEVARQHGSIRVGPATAYVRVDDPAQVAAILAQPDGARLGLRELTPGILIAAAEPYEVIELLHDLGLSPAAENAAGQPVGAPDPLRARATSMVRRQLQPELQPGGQLSDAGPNSIPSGIAELAATLANRDDHKTGTASSAVGQDPAARDRSPRR